ncbi:site-specific integrase [Candidatus Gottesmanbacteria bacterium]|nr:site-specific integrase [Candidatus Gottesmanbacteria bacterium]
MNQVNVSNISSYLDVLENGFINFLADRGTSEKTRKNYRSDTRHFLGWAQLTIESNFRRFPTTHIEFLTALTPDVVGEYKKYLLQNRIPASTVNRRLSAIRNFFRFCLAQSWIKKNPTENLTGVSSAHRKYAMEELLSAFGRDLVAEGASKVTVKNYTNDVQQFLDWMKLPDLTVGVSSPWLRRDGNPSEAKPLRLPAGVRPGFSRRGTNVREH